LQAPSQVFGRVFSQGVFIMLGGVVSALVGEENDNVIEEECDSSDGTVGGGWGPCGICFGAILIIGSIGALGWNEHNFVRNQAILKQAGEDVLPAGCDPDSKHDDKPIHVSCEISKLYDFSGDSEVKRVEGLLPKTTESVFIAARAQIYQYSEQKHCDKKKRLVGGKSNECSYEISSEWVADPIDSGTFTCKSEGQRACNVPKGFASNTGSIPSGLAFGRKDAPAYAVRIGGKDGYGLNSGLIAKFTESVALDLDKDACGLAIVKDILSSQSLTKCKSAGGNILELSKNDMTSVGDLRITFTKSSASSTDTVSIIAMQKKGKDGSDSVLEPWDTGKKGTMSVMNMLVQGEKSSDDMLNDKGSENQTMTWVYRGAFWICMWFGMQCCTGFIVDLALMIPCVGEMLGDLVDSVLCCINMLVSSMVTLVVVGIAYLFVRPMIGGPLLGGALLLCVGAACLKSQGPKKQKRGTVNLEAPLVQPGFAQPAYGAVAGAAQPVQQGVVYPQLQQPVQQGAVYAQAEQPGVVYAQSVPVAAIAQPEPQMMAFACPPGVFPGQQVQVQLPDGRAMLVVVPPGVSPGQQFQVQV